MKKILIIVAVVIVIIIILMVVMKKKAASTTDGSTGTSNETNELVKQMLDPSTDPAYCRKTCDNLCGSMPLIAFGKKRSRHECERDCKSDCAKKMDITALYPK